MQDQRKSLRTERITFTPLSGGGVCGATGMGLLLPGIRAKGLLAGAGLSFTLYLAVIIQRRVLFAQKRTGSCRRPLAGKANWIVRTAVVKCKKLSLAKSYAVLASGNSTP